MCLVAYSLYAPDIFSLDVHKLYSAIEREKERERKTETDRKIDRDRQTDRQTVTERDRQKQIDKQTDACKKKGGTN